MMKFDLSPDVKLNPADHASYQKWQAFLYIIAFALAVYIGYTILFPTSPLAYSFSIDSGLKNTIDRPRNDQMAPLDHGSIPQGNGLYFDGAVIGNYSKVKVSFELDKSSPGFSDGQVTVKKSYQAFLYPEGEPMGFKDGTLVKADNNFYIVSDGQFRRFQNVSRVSSMGFSPDAFKNISGDDMRYNPMGPEISDDEHPDGTILHIKEDYYLKTGGELKKFVSDRAYLDQYETSQAIEKDEIFLASQSVADDMIGYSDGSLISYAEGAYVVSGTGAAPFDLPETFLAKGYDFKNVTAASADEFSVYKKSKIFTIRNVHPDGTIFHDVAKGQWFYIKDSQKHLIPSTTILDSWKKNNNTIEVSTSSLPDKNCVPEKDKLSLRSYSCEIEIADLSNNSGSDYEFYLKPEGELKLDSIDLMFKKEANWKNMRSSLGALYNRAKGTYAQK